MEDTNQKLLIAILVVSILSLITSVAITKEENENGETETKLAGKVLWKR